MPGAAGRIDLDLGLNLGEFNRQLSGIAGQASNQVAKAFIGIGGIIAAAFAVNGLIDFGNQAIKLASDLQEVQNVVDVTFGAMAADVNAFANSALESYGLSELSAKRYTSVMGAMLKSSGLTGSVVRDLSIDITKLAADMASFYNLSTDDAFDKIRSGIAGETEPLMALGVNMNVANMEAYALSQGITKAWTAMSQAEQVLLRYNYLLSATGDAQGDFARNGDSWANQIRVMTEQWKIFQGTMGAGFINILTPVVKGLNWLIAKLQIAAAYFKAFTELVFGEATAGGMGAVTTATEAAASGVGDMGAAATGAGKDVKKAGKAIKGSLGGFDQLNTISQGAAKALDDAAGSAVDMFEGMGATGMDMGSISTPDIDVDPIKAKVQGFINDIKSMFSGAGWNINPLKKSLQGLGDALKPFAQGVGVGLKWFYSEVLVPLGKWTITEALPAFIDVLSGGIRVLTEVITAFMPYGVWLFDNVLQPLAAWSGGLIVSTLQLIAQGLSGLSNWIMNNQETFVKGALFIASFFVAFKVAGLILAIAPIISGIASLVSTIGAFIASGAAVPFLLYAISTAFAAVTSPIVLITAGLGLLIYSFIDLYSESESFREALVDLGNTWLDALQPMANFVKTVLVDAWNKILKPVIDFFIKTLIPNLISIFKQLWQDVLIPLGKFIGTVLKPVFQILADLLMMIWKNVVLPLADAIGSVLAEAWNGIYAILTKTVIPIIKDVITVLQFLWEKVINPIISVLWEKLKPTFNTVFEGIGIVIDGLKTTLVGIIKFITGVFTGDWGKAWEGVKGIFKGVFDSLYGIVKTPLNLIIDAINEMISGLNDFKIDVPDWVPGDLGGKSFGMKVPKIPRLAKGGLAYGPTLAMVGDNKGASVDPEVVSPLSKLQDMLGGNQQPVVAVLEQILRALKDSNARPAVLQVGEAELGRTAARAINVANQQAGGGLLQI
ncbi:hypothetical protein AB4Z29_00295 [Paenibacillus sp. 2TAB23]|uniref:phage tail protein n=1 Tax=Paenibacillus sp. 2TAB23 TaxID=3233004 RepID=UPI003F9A1FF8